MPGDLAVLSLGYTRSLWGDAADEDRMRMGRYADALRRYHVIAHARRWHALGPLTLAPGFTAAATAAWTPLDGLPRLVAAGDAALRRERFDVIQAQDPLYTGLAAWRLARRHRVPLVVCVYGPNVADPAWRAAAWWHRWAAPVGRRVLRAADIVQVDGRRTARWLAADGVPASRLRVKPMIPANLDAFLAVPRAARAGTFRLLTVARLAPQKDPATLIEVVRRLVARGVDVRLEVAGDGPERAAMERAAREAGLGERVTLLGAVGRDALPARFAAADAFLLTSRWEGFPRVLMEAAAAALPVVTTDVGGAEEMVEDGVSGYVCPVGDADALAAGVARLADDRALARRMGDAGRDRARGTLDPATNTAAQLAIWRDAAGRAG